MNKIAKPVTACLTLFSFPSIFFFFKQWVSRISCFIKPCVSRRLVWFHVWFKHVWSSDFSAGYIVIPVGGDKRLSSGVVESLIASTDAKILIHSEEKNK